MAYWDMRESPLFPEYILAPAERDLPLARRPQYVEAGTGKDRERWHGCSHVCTVCGAEVVAATTVHGEYVELAVRARTWRLRLKALKSGYLAERDGGYPEHSCKEEPRADHQPRAGERPV